MLIISNKLYSLLDDIKKVISRRKMTHWEFIYKILLKLKNCFTRGAAFYIFLTIIVGLIIKEDVFGGNFYNPLF